MTQTTPEIHYRSKRLVLRTKDAYEAIRTLRESWDKSLVSASERILLFDPEDYDHPNEYLVFEVDIL